MSEPNFEMVAEAIRHIAEDVRSGFAPSCTAASELRAAFGQEKEPEPVNTAFCERHGNHLAAKPCPLCEPLKRPCDRDAVIEECCKSIRDAIKRTVCNYERDGLHNALSAVRSLKGTKP